jgi:predicted dehydrogenase
VDGHLGRPLSTRAWAFATDIPWWGKHYVKHVSGGGVLASTAVHVLDLALWIAGNPEPITASASMARVFPRKRGDTAPNADAAADFDVEDTFSSHIRFADGSWMTLEGAWSCDRPTYSYSFEMTGDAAAIEFDPLRMTAERDGVPADLTPADYSPGDWGEAWLRSIDDELADVVAAVRDGREPLVFDREALRVQAIVDALYRSAELGHEVAVTTPDADAIAAASR